MNFFHTIGYIKRSLTYHNNREIKIVPRHSEYQPNSGKRFIRVLDARYCLYKQIRQNSEVFKYNATCINI